MIKRHQRNNSQILSVLDLITLINKALREERGSTMIRSKKRRARGHKEKVGKTTATRGHCMYHVSCVISLLRFGFIVHAFGYLVALLSMAWDLPRFIVVSTLPFHFLDSHDVVVSLFWLSFGWSVYFWILVRWSQENSQGLVVEMCQVPILLVQSLIMLVYPPLLLLLYPCKPHIVIIVP